MISMSIRLILVKGNLPQASSSPPGICLFFWRLWNELKVPYAVEDQVDKPVSLYAVAKKSDELMAHAYSKL